MISKQLFKLRLQILLLYLIPYSQAIFDQSAFEKVTVGAYYYPWYGKDFHKGAGYVRKELGHIPALGEYDDSSIQVVQKHLEYSRQANINLWVTSWWGQYSQEDNTTRTVILPELEGSDHKVALLYETTGRLKDEDGTRSVHRVTDDITFIIENYIDHPNYYTVRGRPVIFIYLTRVLDEELAPVLLLMRSTASRSDVNLFLVGDESFGVPPASGDDYLPFIYLDAVTNYDVYGTLPKPYATTEGLTTYYRQQAQWRELARTQVCKFIPSVAPGYNDRGIRIEKDHSPLSRKLNGPEGDFGSLFRYALRKAIPQVDRGINSLIMVNSFNEWHEDTQIEPVNGTLTTTPFNLTERIQYEGYGTRYLDILNDMTTNGSWMAEEEEYIVWLEQLEGLQFDTQKTDQPQKRFRPIRQRPRRQRPRSDVFD